METISILHLFPHEMGINGDVGNVSALVARASWHSIRATVHNFEPGDTLPERVDLVHFGSGPLSAQRSVFAELGRIAPDLRRLAEDGVPVLAIGGGWQLLGTEFSDGRGETLRGVGIFPSRAVQTDQRMVGEIMLSTTAGFVAGYENHSALALLEPGAEPLGSVVAREALVSGEGDSHHEGVRVGPSIGTHLHGPLLPMNPMIADALLRSAFERVSGADALPPIQIESRADEYAANARRAIAERLGTDIS